MKVIAKASSKTYICEINHEELEKFLGFYYGNLGELSVGDAVDLGKGYNYSTRIEDACKQMTSAMQSFDRARETMTAFALAVATQSSAQAKREGA